MMIKYGCFYGASLLVMGSILNFEAWCCTFPEEFGTPEPERKRVAEILDRLEQHQGIGPLTPEARRIARILDRLEHRYLDQEYGNKGVQNESQANQSPRRGHRRSHKHS